MSSNDPPQYPGPQEVPGGQDPYGQDLYGRQPPYDPYSGQPYPHPQSGQPYDPYSGQPYPTQQPYDPYQGQPYQQPQQYGPYPGPMPPAYGYGQPPDEGPKGQAIGALITNIVVTLLCCLPLGIAGIVVSAMAMSRSAEQPESARKLVKWGWGLAIASVVLGIVIIVIYVAFLATNPEFN